MSIYSDKFFADKAVGALWDVAVSIKRGNPLPLDKDSVVHGIDELNALVAGAVSYPGQIIAVIEDAVYEGEGEEKVLVKPESTTLYYLDHDKNPKEVGKVPVGDDVSIDVIDEKIVIHDFGKAFYKYIAEVKDSEGNVTSEARYDKVEVSESNPWKAGLEPKVTLDNGKLVIGWYEPNPTTIEGVNDQVTALQGTVEGLSGAVGVAGDDNTEATGLFKEIDNVEAEVSNVKEDISEINLVLNGAEGEEPTKGLIARVDEAEQEIANKANASDVYTKAETEGLISSAGHLKRKIVDSLPAIEEADHDTIYMVAYSTLLSDNNVYEEFMVIGDDENGYKFEKIGDTKVDLSDYAKSEDVTEEIGEAVKDFLTETEINTAIENATKDFVTSEDVTEATKDFAINSQVEEALSGKADKSELEVISTLATKQELTDGLATKIGEDALNPYAKTEDVNTELGKKVNTQDYDTKVQELTNNINSKLDLKTWNETLPSLATDEEVATIIGSAPTKNEETGDYENATGIYTNIYTKDEITDLIADITGGESAADVLAALNAYKTSTDPRIKAVEDGLKELKDNGAEANVLEGIKINDILLEIAEDKTVNIPVAGTNLGVVKSSTAENSVNVATDGSMSVNSLNANKLTQTDGEFIVLYGGSATDNI